jgi:CHASE2 domain-containing sensor protein
LKNSKGIDWLKRRFGKLHGFQAPLLVALTAFIISFVDPLGIEEATADRANNTIMRLSSTLYGSSNRVTVVVIDQQYLDRRGVAWPLSYAEQGLLLSRLARHKPAAIFVDLLYKNPHARPDDLPEDLLRPVRTADVPIFLAALPAQGGERGRRDTLDAASILPAISADPLIHPRGEPARIGLVGWSGYGSRYPMFVGTDATLRTPAYALYQYYCAQPPAGFSCGTKPPQFTHPLAVRWGAFVPRQLASHYEPGLCQYTNAAAQDSYAGFLMRTAALLRQFARAVLDRTDESTHLNDRLPCIGITLLPAWAVMNPFEEGNQQLIDAALQGSPLVVLGADVPGIPDRVVSPVHGQVPGVVLHAMALDNLLTAGDRYVSEAPDWFMTLFRLAVLLLVAVLAASPTPPWLQRLEPFWIALGAALWLGCAGIAFAQGHTARGMWFLAGGTLATVLEPAATGKLLWLFVIICIVSLVMLELGWEPTNWIVLAVAASLVHQVASRYEPQPVAHAKNKGRKR